jgi:hypothetical protein
MVRDTPPYVHVPTYQISLIYLERQKCYGPDKKILFKKQLFDLEVKGQGPTKVIRVCDTPPYGHAPTYQISLTLPNIIDLSRKKQLFDLEVKGQGPMKVIMVHDTSPYGHAPTYQISLTYLERQKFYGPDKKILYKKPLFDLEVKGQGPIKIIMVRYTPPYGHAPSYQISLTYLERQKCYGADKKILFKKQLFDLEQGFSWILLY